MTTGPTDEESTTAAGGPGGMPLALRLSEGLGPNATTLRVLREGELMGAYMEYDRHADKTLHPADYLLRLLAAVSAATVGANAPAAAELDAMRAEIAELDALREKLAGILSRTAAALRGPEPPLTRWSWHDLPERAAAAIAAIDLMQRTAHHLAAGRLHDSDCAMHSAPAYPAGECDCGALGPNVRAKRATAV